MNELIIHSSSTLRDALIRLNKNPKFLTLFITDDKNKIVGSLTDGDIRRGLISGLGDSSLITEFMNKDFIHLIHGDYNREKLAMIKSRNLHLVPVLNADGTIFKVINFHETHTILPVDAVIMAGGKGKRLLPLTATTPKPLLKIGKVPILDYNLKLLKSFGIQNITLSVNYLSDQIKNHVGNGSAMDLSVDYVHENAEMGTIGSVGLVDHFDHDYILVMNSDLLTTINLEAMFNDLLEANADMIVATTGYRVEVPYGVVETKDSIITGLKEKPTYTYYSNAGIYIFKKEMLSFIPKGQFFNATDLIQQLLDAKKKVMNHPITGYWLDIGKHDDYAQAQRDVEHLSFDL